MDDRTKFRMEPPPCCGEGCALTSPGHGVHAFQAARSSWDKRGRRPAEVVEVRDDGVIQLRVEGDEHWLWHHQPERVRELANHPDLRGFWLCHWGVLAYSIQGNISGRLSVEDLRKGGEPEPVPSSAEDPGLAAWAYSERLAEQLDPSGHIKGSGE